MNTQIQSTPEVIWENATHRINVMNGLTMVFAKHSDGYVYCEVDPAKVAECYSQAGIRPGEFVVWSGYVDGAQALVMFLGGRYVFAMADNSHPTSDQVGQITQGALNALMRTSQLLSLQLEAAQVESDKSSWLGKDVAPVSQCRLIEVDEHDQCHIELYGSDGEYIGVALLGYPETAKLMGCEESELNGKVVEARG